MSEFTGFIVFCCVAAVCAAAAAIFAPNAHDFSGDCDKLGATRIHGVVYDCKRRDGK